MQRSEPAYQLQAAVSLPERSYGVLLQIAMRRLPCESHPEQS